MPITEFHYHSNGAEAVARSGDGVILAVARGGSRKLFWEGHIGLESPKTTKRDAEGVEEEMSGQGFINPLPGGLGERRISSSSGFWGRAPAANDFGHYTRGFVRFHACFSIVVINVQKKIKTVKKRVFIPKIKKRL